MTRTPDPELTEVEYEEPWTPMEGDRLETTEWDTDAIQDTFPDAKITVG